MAKGKEWLGISAMVNEEWPAINLDKYYVHETTQRSPELSQQW